MKTCLENVIRYKSRVSQPQTVQPQTARVQSQIAHACNLRFNHKLRASQPQTARVQPYIARPTTNCTCPTTNCARPSRKLRASNHKLRASNHKLHVSNHKLRASQPQTARVQPQIARVQPQIAHRPQTGRATTANCTRLTANCTRLTANCTRPLPQTARVQSDDWPRQKNNVLISELTFSSKRPGDVKRHDVHPAEGSEEQKLQENRDRCACIARNVFKHIAQEHQLG